MKKFFSLIAAIILTLSFVSCSAQPEIGVYLDGERLVFDVSPEITNGRTMVPLRGIFEAVGAEVLWDGETNTVTAKKDKTEISLTIGKAEMLKDGKKTALDTAPYISQKRTLVPVRAISESFNMNVEWNEKDRCVYISSVAPVGKKLVSHFIDVGQGDCIFVELPQGECMLIDAGEKGNEEKIVSYIKTLGYSKIDFVVCTHPHSDHIGSMVGVINAFDVENIYMPRKSHTSSTYINLLEAIKEKGKKIKEAKSGVEVIDDSGLKIKFVSPKREYEEINDASAVLRVDYYDSSFLFTGDIENTASADITENIDIDVLKASHHGSSNATNRSFLERTTPEYAIISCGKGNSYGHPHKETIALFDEFSVEYFRTDLHGDIKVSTDGKTISVNCQSQSVNVSEEKADNNSRDESFENTAEVYKTKSGKRYHRYGCDSLKNTCISTTREEAEAEGLTPCKACNP